MKKLIVFIALVAVLIFMVVVNSRTSAQECRAVKQYNADTKCGCSKITEGLQFCVSISQINPESDNKIVVNTSLKNMTDKTITVPLANDFYASFNVNITDSSGVKLLSDKELSEKAPRNESISEEEIASLPVNHFRFGTTKELAPQEELKTEFNLSGFYKFESKGKYQIQISRKLKTQNSSSIVEIPSEPIEIEIK